MSRMITAVPCLLLLIPGLPLAAQTEEVTLRIEVTDKYQRRHQRVLTGTLLEPQTSCISIRTERMGELCVPLDSVRKVSMVVGQGRKTGRAMVTGGLVGAVLGAVLGAAATPSCGDALIQLNCGAGFGAVAGGFGGLLLGIGIGGLYAAVASPSPVWRDANPATFTRRGRRIPPVGMGLRVEF